jgi:gas vesicle protein
MSDGYNRMKRGNAAGAGFLLGLLTGTAFGAAIGMLFAPKPGSQLRDQLADQASSMSKAASEGYRGARETAGQWADKGRELYGQAKGAASKSA